MRKGLDRKTFLGIFFLSAALVTFVVVWYVNTLQGKVPVIFSNRDMLAGLWNAYKAGYWDPTTGRTLDRQHGTLTTSEGQSYTMLRAAWQDDRSTFDVTWAWTQKNIERPDHLLSWAYGTSPGGGSGILTSIGGQNSASDADTDTAVALVFAYERWGDKKYLAAAEDLINAIWQNEVISVNGQPVLAADNVERNSPRYVLVNPSYFAPYAYRIFARIDAAHPWLTLVDDSYAVAARATQANLDRSKGGLPPDWIRMDRVTGDILPPDTLNTTLTTNYSYDAMRLPWRFALDSIWNGDPRAKNLLNSMSALSKEWQSSKSLASTYAHDGQVVLGQEAPAIYGGDIGYFLVSDPAIAKDVYNLKLRTLFDSDNMTWRRSLSYYDDNWAWFGIALYTENLPDLVAASGKQAIGESNLKSELLNTKL